MLETKVGGVRVSFCFGFFAVVMFTFFAGGGGSAGIFAALLGCILHEAGHFAAMCLLDQPPERVCFYAGGIKIVPRWGLLSRRREGAILAAGCAVNVLLACGDIRAGGVLGADKPGGASGADIRGDLGSGNAMSKCKKTIKALDGRKKL